MTPAAPSSSPLIIGLTGGIGSGKSLAADRFATHGVPVIDTDTIAHELVQPGRPALAEIADTFGTDLVQENGHLDRVALRERVFADPHQRHQLEAILHPYIREESLRRIAALDTPYCIWVIPLLVETGAHALVDRVLVIDCPKPLQVERVRARDQMSDDIIAGILAAQVSRESRLAFADDIIVNAGDLAELERQVDAQHRAYLALAAQKR